VSDFHTLPDGTQTRLGCLVPAEFPTHHPKFSDRHAMFTMDQIRQRLANMPTGLGRRLVFNGQKWIRNQRTFGSCNGFSTALALSRARVFRGLETPEDAVILSGADAYSQMNGGRDNGSHLAAGLKVCAEGGIAPESLVPWNHVYDHQISAAAKAERVKYKGFEPEAVDTEEELANGLLLGFPAVVAVHVAGSFDRLDGRGVSMGPNGPGNHSVGIDDLRLAPDGTIEFDMFNSWDTTWGDSGRCRLTWNRHFRETVRYHRFWILRSTIDGGDSPPVAN
jgi:hypothetical protein